MGNKQNLIFFFTSQENASKNLKETTFYTSVWKVLKEDYTYDRWESGEEDILMYDW